MGNNLSGMGRKMNLLGQRFGRWLVIKELDVRNTNAYWLCECDCGKTGEVSLPNLRSGASLSCGCLWGERAHRGRPKGGSGFNHLIKRYMEGAKSRGLEFSLTEEDFRALTQSKCHYCGVKPERKTRGKEWQLYVYNGIDRRNPLLGYMPENCVSSCFICNRAKNNLSYEQFTSWIANVVEHNKGTLNDNTSDFVQKK